MNSYALGCDIGGSHITAAIIDLETRAILRNSLVRKRVNAQGSAQDIIGEWAAAMRESLAHTACPGKTGIAMPGPFDYETGISLIRGLNKYDSLYGMNVKHLLANHLEISPEDILLKNDAGCFLQGEVFSGSARGFRKAMGITLGTGFGTAFSENEIAEDAALWCSPFLNSIAEDYFSGRWFRDRYEQLSGKKIDGVKSLTENMAVDECAQQVLDEFSNNLALFLIDVISSHRPDIIVFGGNVANASDLFIPKLEAHFAEKNIRIDLKRSRLGEDAALIGAASLWHRAVQSESNPY